jgi:NADPH-dependent curcumin reductase CurA
LPINGDLINLDYKSADFTNELKIIIPESLGIYFDNVGGELNEIIMNRSAHAAECGQISTYNEKRDV